jgi:hypothetical protein
MTGISITHQARLAARDLFDWTFRRGQWRQLWAKLTRRSRRLVELESVHKTCAVHKYRRAGVSMASLSQIVGTIHRVRDFDIDFYPLQRHDVERWQTVATALKLGRKLPPVKLVQVENVFFVQDGHHRISIARATGRESIEAEVTVWQVGDLLPGASRPKLYPCPKTPGQSCGCS